MGKASAGEFSQLSEYCTSQKQEIEADVVSARCVNLSVPFSFYSLVNAAPYRILAHAGFDPREAARFWEARHDTPKTAECSPARAEADAVEAQGLSLPRRWMGETHPVHEVRVTKLKAELERWEAERVAARAKRDAERAKAEAARAKEAQRTA